MKLCFKHKSFLFRPKGVNYVAYVISQMHRAFLPETRVSHKQIRRDKGQAYRLVFPPPSWPSHFQMDLLQRARLIYTPFG